MGCGSSTAAAASKPDEQRVNVNEFASSRDAAKAFREKQAKLSFDRKENNSEKAVAETETKPTAPVDELVGDSNARPLEQQPADDSASSVILAVANVDALCSEVDGVTLPEISPAAAGNSAMSAPHEDDSSTVDTASAGSAEVVAETISYIEHTESGIDCEDSAAVSEKMNKSTSEVPCDPESITEIASPPETSSPAIVYDTSLEEVQCSITENVEDGKSENNVQETDLDATAVHASEKCPSSAVHETPAPLIESDEGVTRGYLHRRGYVNKAWRRQYFVLYSGMIACYENPIEEYPFGTGLKNYTTLTFGTIESFEKERRLHVYFKEPTAEQQRVLDTLARNSTVTILLEAGAVRELDLQAESDQDFTRWKRALISNISHADEAARQGEGLTIPPEAIPKSDMLPSNQIPVLERSFSKSGTFTSKKNMLIREGSLDSAGTASLGAIEEEITPNENLPEITQEHLGNDNSTDTANREHAMSEETAAADSLRVAASTESEDHQNTSGIADTATTMTGDTRSVGTASTVVEEDDDDGDDEDGIILTPLPFEAKKAAAIAALEGVEIYQEYFLKQGHFFKNWKRRYFVLDSGILYYYEKDIPEPPYGSGLKGFIPLLFAVVAVNTSTRRMHIRFPPLTDEQKAIVGEEIAKSGVADESEEGKDLLIEAETVEQLAFWEECVRKHVAFALAKATQNIALTVPAEHKEAAAKPSKGGGRMKRASILVRNTRADSTGQSDSRADNVS